MNQEQLNNSFFIQFDVDKNEMKKIGQIVLPFYNPIEDNIEKWFCTRENTDLNNDMVSHMHIYLLPYGNGCLMPYVPCVNENNESKNLREVSVEVMYDCNSSSPTSSAGNVDILINIVNIFKQNESTLLPVNKISN